MFLTILIAFIGLVGLLIIHEFGHFILAKKFGVKVEEFGLGYPPRLFGKKVGQTLYSLNLLPFGAFVRICGEPAEILQGKTLAGEEESVKDPASFRKKHFWQKALIILGGVFSFWVMAAILLTIVAGLTIEDIGWWEAPVRGLMATGELTFLIVKGLSMALVNVFSGLPSGVEVMGPVGVFSLFSKAAERGLVYFLYFISVVSVHLAVINLLPIPALDGGKLLFLTIEKLQGRPVPEKIERKVTMFFFSLLIALVIWVTIKDIIRIF